MHPQYHTDFDFSTADARAEVRGAFGIDPLPLTVRTVSKAGLHDLVQSAYDRLSLACSTPEERGKEYPPRAVAVNAASEEGWQRYRKNYLVTDPDCPSVEAAARVAGWADCAARAIEDGGLKTLRTLLRRAGYAAYCSRYNHVFLKTWAAKVRTPHLLEKRLRKIIARARVILAPYGIAPSWCAIADTLAYCPSATLFRTGKAAKVVAAKTLSLYVERDFASTLDTLIKCRGLKEWSAISDRRAQEWALDVVADGEFACLRDALAAAPGRLVEDASDGVEMLIDTDTTQRICRCEVARGYRLYESRRPRKHAYMTHLVRHGVRTYHAGRCDARFAVAQAVHAWRRQDGVDIAARDRRRSIERVLSQFVPFARIDDSIRAGNCEPGTLAWCARNNIDPHGYVPVTRLLASSDPAAQRVAHAVIARFTT